MPFEINGAAKDLVAGVEGSLFASVFKNPIYLSLGITILLIIIIFVITFDMFEEGVDVKVVMLKITIYGFLTILAAVFIHNKMIHHKYEVKALGGDSDLVFNRHNVMAGGNFHVSPNLGVDSRMSQSTQNGQFVARTRQPLVNSQSNRLDNVRTDSFDSVVEKTFGAY